MTKKDFLKFEKTCKKEWKRLAETGSRQKSKEISIKFLNGCPACEVAANSSLFNMCKSCPIDVWRKIASKNAGVVCNSFGAYCRWIRSSDPEERKKLAKAISNYKWTFLPQHKKARLKYENS